MRAEAYGPVYGAEQVLPASATLNGQRVGICG